jgi:hypothetical protein
MVTKKKTVKKKVNRRASKKVSSKKVASSRKKSSVRTKSVKPGIRKKENVSESSSLSKTDFETFKFGVQRLKELKAELNSIDTRGFSKEVQDIRVKLKSVSEIPNIEKSLRSLKLKIKNKYRPKRRKKPSTKKILDEGLDDIEEQIKSLRRSKSRDLGEIREELNKIKKQKYSGPLDSGVDILVDTNFNQFLSQTKKALSNRIHTKEEEIEEVLKSDLERREDKYHRKHENLLRDFRNKKEKLEREYKKKYKQKVESTLHREVSEKFSKMLRDKLEKEKIALTKEYVAKLKSNADQALKEKEGKLREMYLKHKKDYDAKIRDKDEKERREFRDKLIIDSNKKVHDEIARKEHVLRSRLANEYESKLKKKIAEHEAELKKQKINLELEMQKKIKSMLS